MTTSRRKGRICSQCGQMFSRRACGPTHAIVWAGMKKKGRITDKIRLNFLERQDAAYFTFAVMGNYWNVRRRGTPMGKEETGKTIRRAIDAAMKSGGKKT